MRHISPRRAGLVSICVAFPGWSLIAAGWTLLVTACAARGLGLIAAGADLWCALFVVSLLATGATLVLARSLAQGFGVLDQFFKEALARSERRAAQRPSAPTKEQPRRGYVKDRPYVQYGDGRVAVETLLGTRVFPSLAEAEEFIG